MDNPPRADIKTATPEVTSTKATKTATRSSSGRRTTKRRRSTFEIDQATGTPKPTTVDKETEKETKEVKFQADPEMKKTIMAEIEKKVQEQSKSI